MSKFKINLGISNKRAHFDKSHDVNTTSDFGFMQPTLISELTPQSKVSLKSSLLCRMAPMVTSTFGRIQLRTYNYFVPMTDVCESFDYMMANKQVSSAFGSYIPDRVDYVLNERLSSYLFNGHLMNYTGPTAFDSSIEERGRIFGIPMLWKKVDTDFRPLKYEEIPDSVYNLLTSNVGESTSPLNNKYLLFGSITTLTKYRFSQFVGYSKYAVEHPSLYDSDYEVWYNRYMSLHGTLTFDNADLVLKRFVNGDTYYLTIHLTKDGRRFMKILNAIGVGFNVKQEVPLHLLLAYYKAYFDNFNPGRELQWRETNAYFLIHYYYDIGVAFENMTSTTPRKDFRALALFDFLVELCDCCYTLPIDNITVAIDNPWKFTKSEVVETIFSKDGDTEDVSTFNNESPQSSNPQVGISVKALLAINSIVNKESVLGKKVRELLRVKYGITDFNENSTYIGSDKINLNISPVFSTNDSPDVRLGEYAGSGVGYGSTSKHTFETKNFGIIIQMLVVIPFGGYNQGTGNDLRVFRNDFYQPQYDSLGYEVVPMKKVFGSSPVAEFKYGEEIFGFVPRMFSYKYKQNLLSGDFKRRGSREFYMPFCLDRNFTEHDYQLSQNELNDVEPLEIHGIEHQSTESLRYIGLSEDYGNYNRIFYDVTGNNDNFVISMVNEFHVTAPMLPIDDSYDTFNHDGVNPDNSTANVEHV